MSSIRVRTRKDGSSYTQVMFRLHGTQTSESFEDHREALKWQALLDRVGPEKARVVLNSAQDPQALMTVEELVVRHINQLTGVGRGALSKYQGYLRNDIIPSIGSLPLALFDKEADAAWVNYLEAKGNARKTIQNKHGFLSSVMETGVKLKGVPLTHNPCHGRKLPKREPKKEMVVYTPAQFLLHLEHVPAFWHALMHFLVRFGPRWSEATALMPMDFDRKRKTAHIQRAWKWTGTGDIPLGPPKTDKSDRYLEFDEESWDMIEPLLFGADDKFVFTNTVGGPVRLNTFYQGVWRPSIWLANGSKPPSQLTHPDFRPPQHVPKSGKWSGIGAAPVYQRLGIWPRIHDMRHTCASWLIDAGYDLFAISRLLGHESTDTTTRIYGHLLRGKLRHLASGVSQQLRAAEEAQRGAGRSDPAAA